MATDDFGGGYGDHADFAALSRRKVIAGGLVAATASLGAFPAMAADPGAPGIPTDAADRARLVRRMRFRTDAGLVCWWFRGRMYGQQGARLIPLCGMLFGSMIKLTPRADGGFDTIQYELGFRTDLATGERIDSLKNPVTGETITIPFAPVGPTRMRFSAENVPEVPAMLGGSKFIYRHTPEQFWRSGDTVFLQYLAESVVQTAGAPDRVINDFGMIYGPAREALDPRVKSASAWIQGTDVTDYARWLKMPAGSGTQTLRSIGAKVSRFEDMPADWIAMVAKADPAMAANPMSIFDRAEATYKG
jgi:hypothetical protein